MTICPRFASNAHLFLLPPQVNHWLVALERQRRAATASGRGGPARLTAAAKNRRLAFMQRLHDGGEYFSEDSMRQRAPLLYHEYVGQFEEGEGSGYR